MSTEERILSLEAEVKRLHSALTPFAIIGKSFQENLLPQINRVATCYVFGNTSITVQNFINAYEAVKPQAEAGITGMYD